MERRFKLKIKGDSPRSLFLAFLLAKLNCDVYIYDFSKNSDLKKDYQIFLLTNTTKNLLNKFDIWNEIEDISYGFTSLCIKDNLVSEQLLLRTESLSKKYLNTIGWTSNYSEIKNLLINKLINTNNVHFISNNKLIDKTLIFDYEFNFINYDSILNCFKIPLLKFKKIDEQILIFNVYLRGNIEKRLYEINTTQGLLVLTPLNKNQYQIIWNNASSQIKETSLISKSFFLDNLTTLLPNELKVDQIIGDINYFSNSNISSFYSIKNKSIYINENKFKSNSIFDLNFDILIKYILKTFNYSNKRQSKHISFINKFRFSILIKYFNIITIFSFSNFLFSLFTINNIFSLILRKLLFTLFNKTYLLKNYFNRKFYNSKLNNLFK